MSDAVTLMHRDHRVLTALLDRLAVPTSDRVALVEELAARLTAHLRAGEQVYPMLTAPDHADGVADASPPRLPRAGSAEDRLRILRATDPTSSQFDIALREFTVAVTEQMRTESELLRDLARRVGPETLRTAGTVFDARRARELRVYGVEDGPAPTG
ncbi:hypothetical protein ACFP2T_28505 [Plantactinospora solaniradicis]|uniref:Hemerythrin domain-containing protein n=1 Tax=Plantactinospora solaniradicis TaxID=1723736 RepID=A0ABW1KIB6_9ACTN